jgi:hypothetical protein
VTDDSAFKKQVRARMEQTGEKYTVARRVVAGHEPGQPPVALRVFLNPQVDLELTDEAARAYEAADEPGRRDMAIRLLADHLEMAGAADAGLAAGSEILTVQELRIEEISDLIHRRLGRRPGYPRSRSTGTWTTSGLTSTPPGRAWRAVMAMRRPSGSALSWRS